MESKTVFSGNFATGEGQLGNFSAYPDDGDRLFINKRVMENVGWDEENAPVFPFFVLTKKKMRNFRDEEGNISDIKEEREEVTAVFKTIEDLVVAMTAGKRIEIMCAQTLKSAVEVAGLTVAELGALVPASI